MMDSQQVLVVPPQQSLTSTSTLTQQHAPAAPFQAQCAICGTKQKLLRCAKCKCIYYCSTDHQHRDWPTHKQECRQLAKQRQINNRLQQLTNGCSAMNINSNSLVSSNSTNACSSMSIPACSASASTSASSNWPLPFDGTTSNFQYSHNPDGSIILGTNENEIMNSKAESVTRSSNSGEFMGNFVNSSTSDQMHVMQGAISSTDTRPDNSQHRNLASYYQPQQQQQIHVPNQQQQLQPVPHFSNYLVNQHEKSSSYQIGAAVVGDNLMENANERRYEELCRNIINDMNQYGLSVVDDFLGQEKGMQILNEVLNMYSAGVFRDGQLVNNFKSDQDLKTIRGDKITWVKGVEPGCSNVGFLINQIDAVICRANAMRNNGKLGNYVIKERTKAMVACYPGSGSHYVMHVDNPNKDGRVITAIYYLNLNWDSRDSGGVLRIFPEQTKSVADIEPKFDRLIFFWSDKRNPHEVQPAHRTRYAITVWYFDANEREAALNRCKTTQNSNTKSAVVTNNTTSASGGNNVSNIATAASSSHPACTSSTVNSNESHCPAKEINTSLTSPSNPSCPSSDARIMAGNSISNVKPVQVVLPNCYK
ncbi:HIF prolyl hydroxylase [Haematobia irritans]|uniref:HIF prolyl hydroxylase n=1 Tax=Haematobia irritans TaxID=7368 RepID=UPI003F504EFE